MGHQRSGRLRFLVLDRFPFGSARNWEMYFIATPSAMVDASDVRVMSSTSRMVLDQGIPDSGRVVDRCVVRQRDEGDDIDSEPGLPSLVRRAPGPEEVPEDRRWSERSCRTRISVRFQSPRSRSPSECSCCR